MTQGNTKVCDRKLQVQVTTPRRLASWPLLLAACAEPVDVLGPRSALPPLS